MGIIDKRIKILNLFDLLCENISKYIIYEKYIDSLKYSSIDNYNINDINIILKKLEKLYSEIEYNMSNKMYSKL